MHNNEFDVDNESTVDGDIEINLIDVGRISGNQRTHLHRTAHNHFKRFLNHTGSNYTCIDDIPENDIEDKILGYFSDYLIKHVKSIKKYNTIDNYISAVHVMIADKFPLKRLEFAAYYKTLRSNIFKQYKLVEYDTGVPMTDNSECMRRSDLDYICRQLFKEHKHELRAVFTLDWLGVGRISEVIQISI
jgi:hypothetical protein